MNQIFRNTYKKATAESSPDAYEPPRINNFIHDYSSTSAASPYEPEQYTSYSASRNDGPPRVNAYRPVASTSAEPAYVAYNINEPPRVDGWTHPQSYDVMPSAPKPPAVEGNDIGVYDYAYTGKEEEPPQQLHSQQLHSQQLHSQQSPSKRPKPVPPTSVVVEPFGGATAGASSDALAPIVEDTDSSITNVDTASTNDQAQVLPSKNHIVESIKKRPTCSLSLVCYSRGCTMSQIRVTKPSKYANYLDYKDAVTKTPSLVITDSQLFRTLRERYTKDICGFWRRYFSLKTLKRLRLLSYTENTRPTPVPLDDFTMQEVLYAYNHPSEFGSETDWIDWVFRLREPDKRHALEFVEGWNGTRIAIVGTIPCVISTLIGVIWAARSGDAQTAFTVASFILTLCTVLLALLAVISGIDSKAN